jgi:hypothetical protein
MHHCCYYGVTLLHNILTGQQSQVDRNVQRLAALKEQIESIEDSIRQKQAHFSYYYMSSLYICAIMLSIVYSVHCYGSAFHKSDDTLSMVFTLGEVLLSACLLSVLLLAVYAGVQAVCSTTNSTSVPLLYLIARTGTSRGAHQLQAQQRRRAAVQQPVVVVLVMTSMMTATMIARGLSRLKLK